MIVSLICAMAENRVIGRDNTIPWRLSGDLKHFKATTLGHHVIMGRKTFESLRKPLPERTNVVVSRNPNYDKPGAVAQPSLEAALSLAQAAGDTEAFIAGGAQIYATGLALADRIWLTRVAATVSGDTLFPEFPTESWSLTTKSEHSADEKNEFDYVVCLYDRVR
ncbi:MAG: dihydrofolate reductase [Polyangiaceae bacterium]|nr:dihydrofolate reductase [Polyangiaceae bacterium]